MRESRISYEKKRFSGFYCCMQVYISKKTDVRRKYIFRRNGLHPKSMLDLKFYIVLFIICDHSLVARNTLSLKLWNNLDL